MPDHAQTWDKAVERRVVRKIDFILLPLMFIGYSLVYYDKAILGGASVFGMSTDLKLRVVVDATSTPPKVSTIRLSWATSLFYFGMLAGLFPMTYLFQRFHAGRTVGTVVILWGIVAMSTAGVTTHQGLYVQRFFLGFLESGISPMFMVIVGSFYKKNEQAFRMGYVYRSA